ncbi:MAG: hypothetical protein ACKOX6_01945 [Bdellovibrio sp.]
METQTQSVQQTRLQTIDKIRRNYNFMKFSLLPELADFKNDLRWMSSKVGVSIEESLNFQEELLAVGIWKKNSDGSVVTTEKFIEYAPGDEPSKKTMDFLTLNANLAARVSFDGPCWYEYSTIVTTDELRKEFIKNVWNAYQEFLTKSRETKGDQMVSWSHMFTDALALKNDQEEQ